MRFLFVNPKTASRGDYYEFPLGLAYVSSSMKRLGYDTYCLNLCHYDLPTKDLLSETINKNKIDVVCTGGMSIHFKEINEITSLVKEINCDVKTVVGGAIVTSAPEVAAECLQFDFGVLGEGEITMTELAKALEDKLDYTDIDGLIYGARNKYIKTRPRKEIALLDDIPFPDYDGFEYNEYLLTHTPQSLSPTFTATDNPRNASIITSRSCPFSCTFCYHPLGQKYRQRSIDNVCKEIEYLIKEYHINLLYLYDELFSVDKKRIFDFCDRIKKFNLRWVANLRVPDADEDILKAMSGAGVYAIGYGIESMSPKILQSMQKKITTGQIDRALAITKSLNIGIIGNLIFGDPEETNQTVKESLDWWLKNKSYGINTTMIRVLPDAHIYKYAIERGFIKNKIKYMKDEFPIINISKLSNRAFSRLCNFVYWYSYGCDETLVPLGEVMESKIEGSDYMGRHLFSVLIKCPNCSTITNYHNFVQQSVFTFRGFVHVFCRKCWQRVVVKSKDAFRENYKLKNSSFLKYIIVNTINFIICHKYTFAVFNKFRLHFLRDELVKLFVQALSKKR